MSMFLKRYRWNIAISGLFLLGMLIDQNGILAKKSDPRTFTNFCLAGIACFWGTSYMYWWRFSKKIPFDAKRKIAKTETNLGKETQIIPLLARLELRQFLSLIGLSFTLKIGGTWLLRCFSRWFWDGSCLWVP